MHAIGVDIGGTKIAAGVVDQDGTIVAKLRRETDATSSDAVDATIVEVCRELMKEHEIGSIGLAAPGFIGADQATVLFTPNLPWREHPLRDRVRSALGTDVPVVVENDANAAGWAEYRFGVGRGRCGRFALGPCGRMGVVARAASVWEVGLRWTRVRVRIRHGFTLESQRVPRGA